MPANHFKNKGARDRQLFTYWNEKNETEFEKFRTTRETIKQAQTKLRGYIVLPGDPRYDFDRKVFNPAFDPKPLMIIFCFVEADVRIALELAKLSRLPFTVRSGGHCSAGFSSGEGVLIDVSALTDVHVDAQNQIATVATGCPFSRFSSALQTQGMHVPVGECEDVCVGGYVQGGGFGFTSRTFGMNCDNVIDMRVMLADGRIVTASPHENYDLWWALRGGTGGSFGILLSLRYRLRPLNDVFGWALRIALDSEEGIQNAAAAGVFLQEHYMLRGSTPGMNVQASLCFQPGPEGWISPEEMRPYFLIRGLYVGSEEMGKKAIEPLRGLPGVETQWLKTSDFNDMNVRLLTDPVGVPSLTPGLPVPSHEKTSRFVERDLTLKEWESLLGFYGRLPVIPFAYGYLEVYGGAIAAYPMEESAFVHRKVAFNAVMNVFWYQDSDKEAALQIQEQWLQLIEPLSTGHAYQNYIRVKEPGYAWRYWGKAQAGLAAVKRKYDPENWFRFSQCVDPDFQGNSEDIPWKLKLALSKDIHSNLLSERRLVPMVPLLK